MNGSHGQGECNKSSLKFSVHIRMENMALGTLPELGTPRAMLMAWPLHPFSVGPMPEVRIGVALGLWGRSPGMPAHREGWWRARVGSDPDLGQPPSSSLLVPEALPRSHAPRCCPQVCP